MTGIQWADRTWNPVTGCSKVSPGCAHCYAEAVAGRFWGWQYPPVLFSESEKGGPVHRAREFTDVQCHDDRLDLPMRWRKPQRVFVNSMSDLFHKDVPDAFVDRVFAAMAMAHHHTFQILTKRPDRMLAWFVRDNGAGAHLRVTRSFVNFRDYTEPVGPWPLPNVWLGTSVEDQPRADERVVELLKTQAAVRFVSYEPALGPVDFCHLQPGDPPTEIDALNGTHGVLRPHRGRCAGLDWIIVGGESGPGARPCRVDWVRSTVEQCQAAGVPVFVKQLGGKPVETGCPPGHVRGRRGAARGCLLRVESREGGDPAEWPVDLRVREFPQEATK